MSTGYLASKFDYMESGQRDFPLQTQGASFRYLLLSTPRTGSTMVSEMLYATGMAGDPQEYLSTGYIKAWLNARSATTFSIRRYLAELETRKTSPNGLFGIHVHFLQLEPFFKERERLLSFFKSFDRIICLTREDKIAQAVSWWRARTTQVWEGAALKRLSAAEREQVQQIPYAGAEIAERLLLIFRQESRFRELLAEAGIDTVYYSYEQVIADYVGVSRQILADLGVEGVDVHSSPKTSRQGSQDDPAIAQFKRDLGLNC